MKRLIILLTISATFARDYFTMPSQFHFERDSYRFQSEIQLGQARVGEVNGNYWDVKIPQNRKSWALSLAHGHQLMRNILRTDRYPIDIFLATALKESDLGCDHDIIQEEGVEYPLGKTWDAGDGFYQIEGWSSSAYGEMSKLYPLRFPEGTENHAALIGNEHFETATISKVYYDLMAFHYWKYVKGYRPMELFDKSTDAGALIKMLSASFYMGHQTEGDFYKDIFITNRDRSYSETEFLSFFQEEPYGSNSFYSMAEAHAELVHQCVKVFQDSAESVGNPTNNFFYSYYDEEISWTDVESYIEIIDTLYPEVNWAEITTAVKTVFDDISGGAAVSYRYEIAPVIDELILQLPVENPVPGLKEHYSYSIAWDDSLEYDPDFDNSTSIANNAVSAKSSFSISSIPTGFTISSETDEKIAISIYSVMGKKLYSETVQMVPGTAQSITLSEHLSPGIVVLQTRSLSGTFSTPLLIQ